MADVIVNDHTSEFTEAMPAALEKALWKIGAVAEGYAKIGTPVDTGRLRNSITHVEDENSTYIGTNVEYAPYVELGTYKSRAFHMLRNAATKHKAEYAQILQESLEDA